MENIIYGYARVSTQKQKLGRQIDNIKAAYSDAVIVSDIYTGTTQDRPEFAKLLKRVQSGDTIVFDEVSRMSRNAEEGFSDYQDLYQRGVNLVFLKEPYLNTDTYRDALKEKISMTGTDVDIILEAVNKYVMLIARRQIESAFASAENEVTYLRQRTAEGIRRAKQDGKQIGRAKGDTYETKKAKAAKEKIRRHSRAFGGSLTDKECMKLCGIAQGTYYKYKRQIRDEMS